MRRLLALFCCAAFASCSSTTESSPPAGPPPVQAIQGGPKDVLTPFPSDRFTVPDTSTATGLRVKLGADVTADPLVTSLASVVGELNEMDGFSTSGGVIVSFTGPIDIRGITTDLKADPPVTDPVRDADEYTKAASPFYLVNVDPKSPQHGRLHGLVARYWAQAKDTYYTNDDFTLVAQPSVPLLPGTRYVFVVTNALKGKDGAAVARSADADALLHGGATGSYAAEVAAALDELEASAPVKRDAVVIATAFTTASILDETLANAKRARAAAAPALVEPWTVETPVTAPDKRVRFRGVYESPEYRKPAPDGKWTIEDGAPVVQAKVGLEVFLSFADATKSGPRPIVMFAHGLGGTKDGGWGTTERLADLGAAVIAIDSPEHGSRAKDPSQNALLAAFSFFGVDEATHAFDIGRARDNFRQMTSDQLELVRLVNSLGTLDLLPVGAPDGVPDLDVSRILYIGHSFGSVQGPAIFALAPEIHQAVWNVGGDGLMMLLRDSGTFSLLVNALKPPNTADGALGRFFAVTQAIVDPGDPLNYARFGALEAAPGVTGWAARDILLQEVVHDSIVPNSTSEALARAAGLTLADAIHPISGLPSGKAPVHGNLPGGATGAISQFDRIEGGMVAEHGELIFSPEGQTQYVSFFKSGLANPHATVPPGYP